MSTCTRAAWTVPIRQCGQHRQPRTECASILHGLDRDWTYCRCCQGAFYLTDLLEARCRTCRHRCPEPTPTAPTIRSLWTQ